MRLGSDTLITVAKDLVKPMSDMRIQDPVWIAQNPDLRSWTQKPAKLFNKGETKEYRNVVFIDFENPDVPGGMAKLAVDASQLFLLPDQKLRAAGEIRYQDVLLSSDGSRCPVINVSWGVYYGAMHSIASDMRVPSSLADHLLLANGIVIADYSVCQFGQHLIG